MDLRIPLQRTVMGFLIVLGSQSGLLAEPVSHLPAAVTKAMDDSQQWLNEMKGKSPEQIRQIFGAPTEETTWNFRNKPNPQWVYQLGQSERTLRVLFFGGKVITTSLHVLSN